MNIQLTRKTWVIFGLKGGGKSTLAKYIAASYKQNCLYFDTLKECATDSEFHVYQPKDAHSTGELVTVVNLLKKARKYRMFIIDEANRYLPGNNIPLPQEVADLNDWARHPQYNISVGYIARRPVQLNTNLTEIADYLFIFHLGGKNDIRYLNDITNGLGDAVMLLPLHSFIIVYPDRHYEVSKPINIDKIQAIQGQNAMSLNL